jgi:hypothetical protein
MKYSLVALGLMVCILVVSAFAIDIPSASDLASKVIIANTETYTIAGEHKLGSLGMEVDTTGLIFAGINFEQSLGYWGNITKKDDSNETITGWQPTLSYWVFIKYNENAEYIKKWGIAIATPESDFLNTVALNGGVELSAITKMLDSAGSWKIPVFSDVLGYLGQQGVATLSAGVGYGDGRAKWDVLLGYKLFLDNKEKALTMRMYR